MFKISQKLKNFFQQTKCSPFIVFFADLDKAFIVWYVILEYLASKDKNMKPQKENWGWCLSGLGCNVVIRRLPVQTSLSTRPCLGTQPHFEAPDDLRVEHLIICSDYIGLVRLLPRQWPKIGRWAGKNHNFYMITYVREIFLKREIRLHNSRFFLSLSSMLCFYISTNFSKANIDICSISQLAKEKYPVENSSLISSKLNMMCNCNKELL